MTDKILDSLKIEGFRNLKPVTLHFSSGINLFVGENAVGKTSLLESMYILGRGRSFRTRFLDQVIQTDKDYFQLVGQVHHHQQSLIPVGVRRANKKLTARINREPVKRLSDIAILFPIQWVGGNIHRLIEEGPAVRRNFMDWGLFHVKPDYSASWKRYYQILKQRNAALRKRLPVRQVQVWDAELVTTGVVLSEMREQYIHDLDLAISGISKILEGLPGRLSVHLRTGWRANTEFSDELEASVARDLESGFTRAGPHRADMVLLMDEEPLGKSLSRGQQKLAVICLQVAQAQLLKQSQQRISLFLLDDLGSELDIENQARVVRLLASMDAQVFITALEIPEYLTAQVEKTKQFHVKHGVVSEVV